MNNIKYIVFILFLLLIYFIRTFSIENWYTTTTYVNSPKRRGTYFTRPYQYNYPWRYHNLSYDPYYPWGYHPYYFNPVPWNAIRRPMLTSLSSPKDYYIGQWVYAGTGYTKDINDDTYVTVKQLNLVPYRGLFNYKIITKYGQQVPLNITTKLKDGDLFIVPGMESKGNFVFSEADKYSYVYTW